MSFSTCPIVRVHAPVERVWASLSEPANYAESWDAQTRRIEPPGPAKPGQRIFAQTVAAGLPFDVNVLVEGIDEAGHVIHLKTSLPFGITVGNHITCTSVDPTSCQVSFG